MPRYLTYYALILRSRQSGESNRDVWLFTAEEGLLRATVFGGAKSKLRSYASPFHSGLAYVYHEPVKDSRKLSDFDVRLWRPGLRELYERAMAADAIAQTILESHGGGGNWSRVLSLAESSLDALDTADSQTCRRIVLWFLWQWINFLGLMPNLGYCSHCSEPVSSGSMLQYSPRDGSVICNACLNTEHDLLEAGPGFRRWLKTSLDISPLELCRFTLDIKSFNEAQSLAMAILTEALGKRLASWDML